MSFSATSLEEAKQLIPQRGDLAVVALRNQIIQGVAAALDRCFADGIEHVNDVEFLSKVAELAKRG